MTLEHRTRLGHLARLWRNPASVDLRWSLVTARFECRVYQLTIVDPGTGAIGEIVGCGETAEAAVDDLWAKIERVGQDPEAWLRLGGDALAETDRYVVWDPQTAGWLEVAMPVEEGCG